MSCGLLSPVLRMSLVLGAYRHGLQFQSLSFVSSVMYSVVWLADKSYSRGVLAYVSHSDQELALKPKLSSFPQGFFTPGLGFVCLNRIVLC